MRVRKTSLEHHVREDRNRRDAVSAWHEDGAGIFQAFRGVVSRGVDAVAAGGGGFRSRCFFCAGQ